MLLPTSNTELTGHFLPLKHFVKQKPMALLCSLQKLQIYVKES